MALFSRHKVRHECSESKPKVDHWVTSHSKIYVKDRLNTSFSIHCLFHTLQIDTPITVLPHLEPVLDNPYLVPSGRSPPCTLQPPPPAMLGSVPLLPPPRPAPLVSPRGGCLSPRRPRCAPLEDWFMGGVVGEAEGGESEHETWAEPIRGGGVRAGRRVPSWSDVRRERGGGGDGVWVDVPGEGQRPVAGLSSSTAESLRR